MFNTDDPLLRYIAKWLPYVPAFDIRGDKEPCL
ncbi:hypothetical protein J2S76_003249 [Ancylobacter vacuolatus]|uniref:Uncharacterized protein n=1 Tax=Ancylobacter vacuolatus TaxID=223389 RepID=A0ABU0DK75_9HYPH|nr:hypothetical protein [Ancylobacter vacuolatus]